MQLIRKQETVTMEYPSSLLYRMATNISLNIIRTQKRREEVAHEDEMVYQIATDEDSSSALEARSVIDRIFRREKPSTKLIAVYHFVDGMSLEQTAQEVKMSVSGVRKRLRQLKERLQLTNDGI